jgi:hypothetical protein
MRQRHLADSLAAFVDNELPSADATLAAAHVAECDNCRAALDEYQLASNMMRQLTMVEAPASVWTSIEDAWRSGETNVRAARRFAGYWPRALAVAALFVLAIGSAWFMSSNRPRPYDVIRVDASAGAGRLSIGEWIETGATSGARIRVGEIGTVDVAPNTRVQLLTARATEHRLNLARGTISAEILAPPRLFFVETPAATVVDLGCAYTMEVDEAGVGRLSVTSGWASLETGALESLVPAGASCPTRPEGPGTPAFDDASERLRQALLDFDYARGGSAAIEVILAESRQRDTLTLWHLLSRVGMDERPRVFDRMVALAALPVGVTREKALALDPATLQLWREELAWTW